MNTRSGKEFGGDTNASMAATGSKRKKTAAANGRMTNTAAAAMDDSHNDADTVLATAALRSMTKTRLRLHEAKECTSTEKQTRELTKESDVLQEIGLNHGGKIDLFSDDPSCSFSSSSPSDSSLSSSFSESSSSSSSSSSTNSDNERKSKKRSKKKKRGHYHKNNKRQKKRKCQHSRQRACHPKEAIKRYQKVLKAYKKGRKLSAAYRMVGVDRNTIVVSALMCKVLVVDPERYRELLGAYTPQQQLQDFAKQCLEVVNNDSALLRDVENQKKKGKLIPLSKRA